MKVKDHSHGVLCEPVTPVLQLRELRNHVQGAREQSVTVVGSVLLCHLANKLQFVYIMFPSSSTSDFGKYHEAIFEGQQTIPYVNRTAWVLMGMYHCETSEPQGRT